MTDTVASFAAFTPLVTPPGAQVSSFAAFVPILSAKIDVSSEAAYVVLLKAEGRRRNQMGGVP